MGLTDLTIRNFRNIAALDLELPEAGAVIIGGNGQGKTNLLEGIYYLVLFRSFRGAHDRELVRFDTPGFFVAGSSRGRVTAGYEVAGKRKKVTIDRAPVHRLASAVGHVVAVAFSPADRQLVSGGPAVRRRYLDVLLSLSDSGYLAALSAMRAALKQRNAALRLGREDAARAFDEPFAAAADQITAARARWVDRWAPRFSTICSDMGEQGVALMQYYNQSGANDPSVDLRQQLVVAVDRDLRRGATTVGPHLDDLRLVLGGRTMRAYASAGQQRTAAIALRLIEAETLAEATGQMPIGLYDDVFAELDPGRQANLLRLIRDTMPGQAIVTAPRDAEVPQELFDRPRWTMTGGTIEQ
ncbi:MAG: DNA replication and repair protein RecF [Gemmatimonadetes bacterium]|nr:DNA replication and repair protein RecF [Gemmatimonadota bacterium]